MNSRANQPPTRILLLALLALVASLGSLVEARAQEPDPTYLGQPLPVDGGVALLTSAPEQVGREALAAALLSLGCQPVVIAITADGRFELFLPEAPSFVNEASAFPEVLGASTPFFVRCASDGAPGDPSLVAWVDAGFDPPSLNAVVVQPSSGEAWVVVDPDDGSWTEPDGISELVPLDPRAASGRYWLVNDNSEAAILDTDTGGLVGVGQAWFGVASATGDAAALIRDTEGESLTVRTLADGVDHELGMLGKPVHLAWSLDGTLAISHGDTLFLASAPGWDAGPVGDFPGTAVAWSPSGDAVAFFDADGLYIAEPSNLAARQLLVPIPASSSPAAAAINQRARWSPDGEQIAYTTGSSLRVVTVDTGAVTSVMPPNTVQPGATFAWSPGGASLAVEYVDGTQRGVAVASATGDGAYRLTRSAGFAIIDWFDAGIAVYVCACP